MKWKIHIINYFHKQKRTLIILIRKNWQLVMEKTKWERWEKLVSVILILVNSSEWVSESRSVVSDSLQPHRLYSPWNSPGQNTGVGSHALLQRIFLTQGSKPGIPHCRRILYHLVHRNLSQLDVRCLGWGDKSSSSEAPRALPSPSLFSLSTLWLQVAPLQTCQLRASKLYVLKGKAQRRLYCFYALVLEVT